MKTAFSPFYTIFAELIWSISRLVKNLEKWYPDGTKKGDTKYGKYTCRLGFQHLPFYINANRDRKPKNMNAAEGIPTKTKARPIQQKARLPNDRTQGAEMTPDLKSGVISLPRKPGAGSKKQGGKIHPNTSIIAQADMAVNGKMAAGQQNLCSAQKQMCAFGKHSVLKS